MVRGKRHGYRRVELALERETSEKCTDFKEFAAGYPGIFYPDSLLTFTDDDKWALPHRRRAGILPRIR